MNCVACINSLRLNCDTECTLKDDGANNNALQQSTSSTHTQTVHGSYALLVMSSIGAVSYSQLSLYHNAMHQKQG